MVRSRSSLPYDRRNGKKDPSGEGIPSPCFPGNLPPAVSSFLPGRAAVIGCSDEPASGRYYAWGPSRYLQSGVHYCSCRANREILPCKRGSPHLVEEYHYILESYGSISVEIKCGDGLVVSYPFYLLEKQDNIPKTGVAIPVHILV